MLYASHAYDIMRQAQFTEETFLLLERLAYGTCIEESNFCPIVTMKDLLTIVKWSDKLVRLR